MEAAGVFEEDAVFGSNGGLAAKEIFEDGKAGLFRMVATCGLTELHLVADEDDVPRGGAHGDDVGDGDLSGFVDKEIIETALEALVGEEPGGAGKQIGVVDVDVVVA